jgi:hypothetical protein
VQEAENKDIAYIPKLLYHYKHNLQEKAIKI